MPTEYTGRLSGEYTGRNRDDDAVDMRTITVRNGSYRLKAEEMAEGGVWLIREYSGSVVVNSFAASSAKVAEAVADFTNRNA